MILFYEHYGKANSFNVTWYDEPKEWGSESGNKTISIDLVKNPQLLYKLTIFINTGVIQAQGQSGLSFATRDFPVLKTLVADICKFNNKNDTEHWYSIDNNSDTDNESVQLPEINFEIDENILAEQLDNTELKQSAEINSENTSVKQTMQNNDNINQNDGTYLQIPQASSDTFKRKKLKLVHTT